jgi:hypothetical protein
MPAVFPLEMRVERPFGLSEEVRQSLVIAFGSLDQRRPTASE